MSTKLLKVLLQVLQISVCSIVVQFCVGTVAFASGNGDQRIEITGTIKDESGQPLPGASVQEAGTSNGTVTDADGKFTITAEQGGKLIVSYIGYVTQEIEVTSQTTLDIQLKEDAKALQEVVVVGYGEQKKANLTGAVETAKFDGSVNTPVTNTAQLMYGKFSGVQITQSSGLPGNDNSSVLIRGQGTFGGSTPLVVIDNMQYETLREFNNLAPSDIESITVLKDASASAIYGARGANGVIVVTTKKGQQGKLNVDYNNYFGIQQVTVVPQYLDAVNYAILRNEQNVNLNGANAPVRYSDANIQAIKDGSSPDQYANTNWSKVALQDAPVQNHYLGFSGGNDRIQFRTSLGYLSQGAIVKGKFNTDRYTLSLNLSAKVNDWLKITNVTNAFWNKFVGPSGGPDAITGETGIINQFQRSAPTVPVYYSNGQLGFADGSYLNTNFSFPINNVLQTGYLGDYKNDNYNISERVGLTANIYKGLTFETSGSIVLNTNRISNFLPTYNNYDWAGNLVTFNALNSLKEEYDMNYRLLNENILRYSTHFGDHNVSVMAGQSTIFDHTETFTASSQGFPSNALQQFDAGGVTNPSVSGSAYDVAWRSFFDRVNYNYNDKYMLEVNIRRDGSSKFGPSNRYGVFPSFGVGWNLSRENFMSSVTAVTGLKLRGTWGKSGNDRIGNYIWQQTYNTGLDYTLGNGTIVPAVALTSLANANVTWETVTQYDIGLDAGFLKNKLYLNVDYFNRASSNLLYTNFPIPSTIGVTNLAAQNAAGMLNEGVEVTLNYRSSFNKIKYTVGGNVTWMADNKVTNLGPGGQVTISNNTIVQVGSPYQAYYGYKVAGIFQTAGDVTSAPVQFGSTKTSPGDFKYQDFSGPNGTPDGIINASDRVVIGNPYPKWIYNFNLGVEYGGFDLKLLFQGLGRVDRLLQGNGQLAMDGDRNNALSYWINRWTPTNTNTNLPRLGGVNNSIASDFYIVDASYLRLKNVELGYSLPDAWLKKVKIQKLRVFVSGQNILTFTKMKNFDPERTNGTNTDQLAPLYKVYSAGLNIKF